MIMQKQKEKVESAMKDTAIRFTDREKKILEMRFGLNKKKTHTLSEIGEKFGVTRERIRQIQERCLFMLENEKKAISRLKKYEVVYRK